MIEFNWTGIQISARLGGSDTYQFDRCITRLNDLFSQLPDVIYCDQVVRYAVSFDVDGSVFAWQTPTYGRVRVTKRYQLIGVTANFRTSEWQGLELLSIKRLIAARLYSVLNLIAKRMIREKWEFKEYLFRLHVNSVIETFLSDQAGYPADLGEMEVRKKLKIMVDCKKLAALLGEEYGIQMPGVAEFLASSV